MLHVLAVDDEPLCRLVLCEALGEAGHVMDQAGDGVEAIHLMEKNRYDLVLLDRVMPRLDGIGVLKRMKADPALARIPVIMQTGSTSAEEIREGFEAGALYYLAKPVLPEILRVLVAGLVADIEQQKTLCDFTANLSATINLLASGEFSFRTPLQARSLSVGLAQLCDNPEDAGIGLLELMINAVEHGNLGITYAEKTALRQTWQWDQEIERRLENAPWCERTARIGVRRVGCDIEFTIADDGDGFDWQQYLQIDLRRAFDVHGRGIAIANKISFSRLDYQSPGNVVVARAPAKTLT